MKFYDMHSHILPEIDDGAKTVKDSVWLLKKLKGQGVDHVCFTPHYLSQMESIDSFLQKRQTAFETLRPHIPKGMNTTLGAEVYVTDLIFNNTDLLPLCYQNTSFMLVEFPYSSSFVNRSMRQLNMLINNYGITPVIAHIERYKNLIGNPEVMNELCRMGVLFQVNVNTFCRFTQKHKMLFLAKNDYVHLLGTDTHGADHNPPEEYSKAVALLKQKRLTDKLRHINTRAERFFAGNYCNSASDE